MAAQPLLKKSARRLHRVQVTGTGRVIGIQSSKVFMVEICDFSPGGISFLSKKPDFQKSEPVQIEILCPPETLLLKGFIISSSVSQETMPLARFSVKFERKFSDEEYKELLKFFVFK